MWAVMSSPLLISADVGQQSAANLETWGNEELIAVNQEFREGGPYQGARLAGGDLSYTPGAAPTGSGKNVWGKLLSDDDAALVFVSNEDAAADVACDASCFEALLGAGATGTYAVRDLWARAAVGQVSPPYSLTATNLASHGGVAAFRLSLISE